MTLTADGLEAKPLPIAVQPMVNESWRSYLGRVAHAHACRIEGIAARLGVWRHGRWLASCRVSLADDHARQVARMLNLTLEEVVLMHPARWDGIALQVAALAYTGPNRWPNLPPAWTYTANPRACPTCRKENPTYTSLLWHLPWITHCVRHRAVLIDGTTGPPAPAAGLDRTQALVGLLDNPGLATFAGAEVPARLAVRAWLECAALFSVSEYHRHWRRPPTIHEADYWLSCAARVAQASGYTDAENVVREAVRNPTLGESHYRQARHYSPPLRDLIDSALSNWSFHRDTRQPGPDRIAP